ncbi:MAG: nucleotide exchange factor GrpE [Gemmataceae bacterium]
MIDPNTQHDEAAAAPVDGANGANPGDGAAGETLESVRGQRDDYLDLLQRTRAEFENYQKRNQREREQERRYAHSAFALDLLPVLDNLERALAAATQADDKSNVVEGVSITLAQVGDMLRRHGITPIEAKGQPFDPNLHHAVMKQPAQDVPPNTVVQVLEKGYMIHDRVLRPATVIVAVNE